MKKCNHPPSHTHLLEGFSSSVSWCSLCGSLHCEYVWGNKWMKAQIYKAVRKAFAEIEDD